MRASVNAMLLAISSGRAPDVGLATSTNSIGEFALRNAVVELSGLEGFAGGCGSGSCPSCSSP